MVQGTGDWVQGWFEVSFIKKIIFSNEFLSFRAQRELSEALS